MTTSSGKPPFEEPLRDESWATSHRADAAESSDPSTEDARSPARGGSAQREPAPEIYGAGVPYGGDDRTEEIDPVAMDAPFTSGAAGSPAVSGPATASAPPAAPSRRESSQRSAPIVTLKDFEVNAPVAQLVLSDLFDSTPPPASMEPPDPAAFSSSRPPPAEAPRAAASGAVVALPSIDVGGETSKARGLAPSPTARPAVFPPPAFSQPAFSPPSQPPPSQGVTQPAPSQPPPAQLKAPSQKRPSQPAPPPEDEPPQRRSVPTLESTNNAASKPTSRLGKSARARPSGSEPEGGEVARFPSDVPTSRPPDVIGTPSGMPAPAATQGSEEGRTVQVPPHAPVQPQKAGALPSIMLAADVEAEPDSSARRALRAARATVRIELPSNFVRPGSPVSPGSPGFPPEPKTTQIHVARAQPALARRSRSSSSFASKPALWGGVGVLLALVGVLIWLWPRSGSLVVTALGPGNRAVENVTIFVDGDPLCVNMPLPCRIEGLAAGAHTLRAEAPGLATPNEAGVEITSGEEATLNLDLVSTEQPEVQAGGLKFPAAASGELTLYLDGKRVGKLPQEVFGLASGKHWIKLDPEDGSPAIEKSVNVLPGEVVEVDASPMKRDKALVTLRLSPESEGASVTLDDAFVLDFPAELELEPKTVHRLTATKPGYEDYQIDLQVEEGETEKLIEIALTPLDGVASKRPKAKPARKAAVAKASTTSADATQGLLNISSVPPSQVILNGRPLGSTPKNGIVVPGDSLQTIVFVHPKMGRRRAQKFVPAGKERTVAIRF